MAIQLPEFVSPDRPAGTTPSARVLTIAHISYLIKEPAAYKFEQKQMRLIYALRVNMIAEMPCNSAAHMMSPLTHMAHADCCMGGATANIAIHLPPIRQH